MARVPIDCPYCGIKLYVEKDTIAKESFLMTCRKCLKRFVVDLTVDIFWETYRVEESDEESE